MTVIYQKTLRRRVSCTGVGLHSGKPVDMTLHPAPADSGIVFRRADLDPACADVPVRADAVAETMLGTTISNGRGGQVLTIEHLLSAFAGLGLDNALVELDAPEIPIMDGSAAMFMELMIEAGLEDLDALRNTIRILKPIEVRDGEKWARLEPHDGTVFEFEIDFPTPVIGRQSYRFAAEGDSYAREIGPARTFGFLKDVDAMRAMGLALGGSLENAIVIDNDRILNEEGLRYPDEFVRHKILDAIGDLYVLGAPLTGRYTASRAGHEINNRLARALLASPDVFERAPARQ